MFFPKKANPEIEDMNDDELLLVLQPADGNGCSIGAINDDDDDEKELLQVLKSDGNGSTSAGTSNDDGVNILNENLIVRDQKHDLETNVFECIQLSPMLVYIFFYFICSEKRCYEA